LSKNEYVTNVNEIKNIEIHSKYQYIMSHQEIHIGALLKQTLKPKLNKEQLAVVMVQLNEFRVCIGKITHVFVLKAFNI